MADQERSLLLTRPGVSLCFSKHSWGGAWGSVHIGRRAPVQVAFATARQGDVWLSERTEDGAAAVWIGDAAFDLLDCEVDRVRKLFGLPTPARVPAEASEGERS